MRDQRWFGTNLSSNNFIRQNQSTKDAKPSSGDLDQLRTPPDTFIMTLTSGLLVILMNEHLRTKGLQF
jgi:hypothetical protein